MTTATLSFADRLDQDAGLSAATEKLNNLQSRRLELRGEIDQLQRLRSSDATKTSIEREAERLLDGSDRSQGPTLDDLQRLHRELQIHDAAIEIAERVVADNQARVRSMMRNENQPAHAQLLAEFRDALVDASSAAAELERFYDATDNCVHRTMRPRFLGEFNATTGEHYEVSRWLAEADEHHCYDDASE